MTHTVSLLCVGWDVKPYSLTDSLGCFCFHLISLCYCAWFFAYFTIATTKDTQSSIYGQNLQKNILPSIKIITKTNYPIQYKIEFDKKWCNLKGHEFVIWLRCPCVDLNPVFERNNQKLYSLVLHCNRTQFIVCCALPAYIEQTLWYNSPRNKTNFTHWQQVTNTQLEKAS